MFSTFHKIPLVLSGFRDTDVCNKLTKSLGGKVWYGNLTRVIYPGDTFCLTNESIVVFTSVILYSTVSVVRERN